MTLLTGPFSILSALFLLVFIGFQCERTKLGRQLSAPLIILLLSFLCGNSGLLPHTSPIYDAIQATLVPLAIPLLLFRANIKKALTESKRVFLAFMLAVVFTLTGAIIAALAVDLGPMENQLVGVLSASYIGGSANFVATAEAVGFNDSSLYTSALTADAIGAMFFLTILMLLPGLTFVTRRFVASAELKAPQQTDSAQATPPELTVSESPERGIMLSLATSAVICAIATGLSAIVPVEGIFIITITILSLLVANAAPQRFLQTLTMDMELGTLFMYIFFATIGVGADISAMAAAALPIVLFLIMLVSIHIVMLVWIGALFKLSLAELMVASCACILGPSAAAAIAAGKGWQHLVTAGMLAGTLGYAVANFCGLALYKLL